MKVFLAFNFFFFLIIVALLLQVVFSSNLLHSKRRSSFDLQGKISAGALLLRCSSDLEQVQESLEIPFLTLSFLGSNAYVTTTSGFNLLSTEATNQLADC